jgi:hypothetical protein
VHGEDAPGLREPAAPSVSFNEALPGRGFEETEVFARRRLSDPDGLGSGGDASAAVDLDE